MPAYPPSFRQLAFAIELYRHSPTALVAPGESGTGTLVIVGRDRSGGVAWHVARVVVE
jgi:hypothetical protein